MAISAAGIGSGLDVNSIVEKLMQAEQQPLVALAQREASFQARLTSLGTIKGVLSTVQGAAEVLAGLDAIAYRASASDTNALGAVASTAAMPSTYSVNVTRLAQGQKLVAAGQASSSAAIGGGADTGVTLTFGTVSGGTLSNGLYTGAAFTPDAGSSPVSFTIGAANNTLEGIRDAINAAGAGVTASIINDGSGTPYRLALSATATGAATSLRIEVSGEAAIAGLLAHDPSGTQNLVQTQAAQDAALTIDGVAVTRSVNTVADAVPGVTLTLKAPTASTATLSVTRDYGSTVAAVQAFVDAYNDANKKIGDATGKGAQLQGDTSVLGLQRRLRSALGAEYGDPGDAFRVLSGLGVTYQLNGALAFDEAKLTAALDTDAAGALATLAAAGSAVESLAENALGTDGVIDAGTDRLSASIESISERRAALERRLEDVERRYRSQFAALDVLLGSMNQTSAFLERQLALLPDPTQ